MANIGKKILSAFVEVTEEEAPPVNRPEEAKTSTTYMAPPAVNNAGSEKFRQYFDQLFKDANLPGPDYYEFAKMTAAMTAIADEKSRYSAAFAGLSVQGVDKEKLLASVMQYIHVLDTDASNFNSTVDATLKEKVQAKQREIESNAKRIEALSTEIIDLQNKMNQLQLEVKENEEKIDSNSGAYLQEMQIMKNKMLLDAEKIERYV